MAVDSEPLGHVLESQRTARRRLGALVTALVVLIAVGALASVYALKALFYDYGEDQAQALVVLVRAGEDIRESSKQGGVVDAASAVQLVGQLGRDPWGGKFHFEVSPSYPDVCRLYTLGADGLAGGSEADEDIVLWIDVIHGLRNNNTLIQPPFGLVWQ